MVLDVLEHQGAPGADDLAGGQGGRTVEMVEPLVLAVGQDDARSLPGQVVQLQTGTPVAQHVDQDGQGVFQAPAHGPAGTRFRHDARQGPVECRARAVEGGERIDHAA